MDTQKNDAARKQLFLLRLQTLMLFVILLLVLTAVLFLVIKGNEISALVHSIDTVQINEAVGSLKTAADTLGALDTEKLNAGIGDLTAAAENLRELDFEKLKNFMDSMEELGKQMDLISGFFGTFLKK